jgi:hypothetical protein
MTHIESLQNLITELGKYHFIADDSMDSGDSGASENYEGKEIASGLLPINPGHPIHDAVCILQPFYEVTTKKKGLPPPAKGYWKRTTIFSRMIPLDYASTVDGVEKLHAWCNSEIERLGAFNQPTTDESQPIPLSTNQMLVLTALDQFSAERLVSIEQVIEQMYLHERLSARTVSDIIKKLISCGLAERPSGERQGVRLTLPGRRQAKEVAD